MNKKIDKKSIYIVASLFCMLFVSIFLNVLLGKNIEWKTNSGLEIDDGDTKINWNKYTTINIELDDSILIKKSGIYHMRGNLEDGLITIDAGNEDVKLILDNVSINNTNGPAIYCKSADDVVIELIGNNYISDGKNYDVSLDSDVRGAIYSKDDLSFIGDGSLSVMANYEDGIVSKDDLTFRSGIYDIESVDDGLRGKDSVHIAGGKFEINSIGDAIKSTNEERVGKGFVLVEDSEIDIIAANRGIRASKNIVVNNGKITVANSYEGMEAQKVTIKDGEIFVNASDDGINAGGMNNISTIDEDAFLIIDGGKITINANGDGIDSNGFIYLNGGDMIIDGPVTGDDGALDSNGGIIMNGGKLVAVGANETIETLNEKSLINSVDIYLDFAKTEQTYIEIKDFNENTIISHVSAKTFDHIIMGSGDFKIGETYTIYLDGIKYDSFVVASKITIVGNNRIDVK